MLIKVLLCVNRFDHIEDPIIYIDNVLFESMYMCKCASPFHSHNNHTDKRTENNFDINLIRSNEIPLHRTQKSNNTSLKCGDRIRELRLKANMSIRELALNIEISPKQLGLIENNLSIPSLPTLKTTSELLDAPVSYLGCYENMLDNTLGQKIKKARFFHGLTTQEVAKQWGVTIKTIYNWEADKTQPLDIFKIKIEQFLSILYRRN